MARDLAAAGHDAVHVRDLGMAASSDAEILSRALDDGRIVLTQDADFGTLLVASGRSAPSVILFRLRTGNPAMQSKILIANLAQVEPELAAGAIVVLSEAGMRIRSLSNES